MKIAIFGFDKYGEKIAATLKKSNVIIVVFDENEEQKAKEKFFDVIKLNEINDEELQKIENIEYAICTLKDEEKNLFLVLSLRELFPELKIVVKISNKENEYKYKLAGANKLLNPFDIIANRIMTILKKPLTLKVIEEIIFKDNKLSFAEIEIPENSFLEGKAIKDVYKEITSIYNLLIIGIVDKEISENVIFIVRGINHILNKGDILVAVGDTDEIDRFKRDLEIFKGRQ
ncbi:MULTISPECIES: potassium channel family protein [unclassified Lebetimonas]|uniref:potassium channel family protein n=1 Tax=unclassified Lebetimonas TaxID=2648158 RepID=UPI00046621B0|nr:MULTISPECIES: NAD-binding protein [unclassified Lebetimonas]